MFCDGLKSLNNTMDVQLSHLTIKVKLLKNCTYTLHSVEIVIFLIYPPKLREVA